MPKIPKQILELIPVVAFAYAYFMFRNMIYATKVLMVASVTTAVLTLLIHRKMTKMMWTSTILVVILGSITLLNNDPVFIKMKPTFLYCIFALTLLISMFFNKLLIKVMLERTFDMGDDKWRKLTIAWVVFFLSYACLNEVIWRNFHEDVWVKFKLFGMIPMMMIFMVGQVIILRRYLKGND